MSTFSLSLLHKVLIAQTISKFLTSKIRGKREHSNNNRQCELISYNAMAYVFIIISLWPFLSSLRKLLYGNRNNAYGVSMELSCYINIQINILLIYVFGHRCLDISGSFIDNGSEWKIGDLNSSSLHSFTHQILSSHQLCVK